MDFEVNQAVGEADEEEAIEVSPELELENALEQYRNADVAKIHLEIHNLTTLQSGVLEQCKVEQVEWMKIDEYIEKVKDIIRRKDVIEKKAAGIKKRFAVVMEALKKKKVIK